MDVSTANILNRTTQAFYVAQAASFSATRQSAWAGWQRVLAETGWEGAGEVDGESVAVPGNAVARLGAGAGRVVLAGKGAQCEDTRAVVQEPPVYRILDVACGNVRFKSFLEGAIPHATWDYCAVDNCEQLVGAPADVVFVPCDIISALIEGYALPFVSSFSRKQRVPALSSNPNGALRERAVGEGVAGERVADKDAASECAAGGKILGESPARKDAACEDLSCGCVGPEGATADLTACFGFFHHVPGHAARERLLRDLCAATVSGGLVAVSLWRFMDDPGLAKKAHDSHEAALKHFTEQGIRLNLDEGDYLLGWQKAQGTFRYCHHFVDGEVAALAASVADTAYLVDRFRADGRTGNLNEYLVFRVR